MDLTAASPRNTLPPQLGSTTSGENDVTDKLYPSDRTTTMDDIALRNAYFFAMIAGCTLLGVIAIIAIVYCWFKSKEDKENRHTLKYQKITQKDSSKLKRDQFDDTDSGLAESAQVFHYHHQKKQLESMDRTKDIDSLDIGMPVSEDDVDDNGDETENEDDFTMYECPGLGSNGDVEVTNPLFEGELTHHQQLEMNDLNAHPINVEQ
ncbi:uncharacterized protein TRIADDRAFT_53106 [Trichoplax adhaerens]|uniref:Neural proliferation differentiation and control protein 1 n=1 Tax=Trichoplax adhaerens TaxID=10228 RepID=B3RNB6_TRIAD|nr:hypothetical protein TRIADDRAFT_53106 [Trichoplax adhaerens]EDV27424.1 hypothetical protein TRIADDRAFT_53106 [Trichoplax adhaerens]|eukprot:XP_002109258.1 hypothetical protein TRIADDRAFT_53106 [Trichoplax adhaerens]